MLEIIIAVILICLLLWVIEQLPLPGNIKRIVQVVVSVLVLIWILQLFFGVLGPSLPYRPILR